MIIDIYVDIDIQKHVDINIDIDTDICRHQRSLILKTFIRVGG